MSRFGRFISVFLLYLAVFVLLVVTQFPQGGTVVSAKGQFSIKARGEGKAAGLDSLEIGHASIRLLFSAANPLRYRTGTGKDVKALPMRYTESDSGVTVYFSNKEQISIKGDSEGAVVLTVLLKEPASKCFIAYKLTPRTKVVPTDDSGTMKVQLGDGLWQLENASVGQEKGFLSLVILRGLVRPFIVSPIDSSRPESPVQYLAQTPVDPALWAKEVSVWQDKAWNGLSSSRFSPDSIRWRTDSISFDFSEPAFMAYVAEALRRGNYEAASAAGAYVRANYPDSYGWKASVFAGRTASKMSAREESDLLEVKILEKSVQAKSEDIFYKPGIVEFLFDRSPYALAQEAMSVARTMEPGQADLAQSVQIVENYLAARNYLEDAENPFIRASDLVDKNIASAIRKTDSGFFLQTSPDGRSDTLLGARTGMLLIKMAEASGKAIYAGIGQSLVSSLLKLADGNGSLPEYVTVRSGTAEPSAEKIMAEAVYPFVAVSPYFPHAVSFYRELGPGVWAWTGSSSLRLTKGAQSSVFTADFPVGISHYLTLYGIKPYVNIKLYNINYNMDSEFEIYNASGYYYRRASAVLYAKMKHKSASEDIRLEY